MKHYLAILVPQEANGWSARMPDFPSCRVASRTADLAKMHIAREASILVDQMRRSGGRPPLPRALEAIRADEDGALDLSRAIVTMVGVRA